MPSGLYRCDGYFPVMTSWHTNTDDVYPDLGHGIFPTLISGCTTLFRKSGSTLGIAIADRNHLCRAACLPGGDMFRTHVAAPDDRDLKHQLGFQVRDL